MPLLEDIKRAGETLTGIARPRAGDVVVRRRKAHAFAFADDGDTPNNPHFALILYRTPVRLTAGFDPAAIFEALFEAHGWRGGWRDGIYDFLHFHTNAHEVLGIARGHARVQFGGVQGRVVELRTGDVVVLPAGTGHRRLEKSNDLLVVGAYPGGGDYDQPRPREVDHDEAVRHIARVGAPAQDPVYGKDGPLIRLWRETHREAPLDRKIVASPPHGAR